MRVMMPFVPLKQHPTTKIVIFLWNYLLPATFFYTAGGAIEWQLKIFYIAFGIFTMGIKLVEQ